MNLTTRIPVEGSGGSYTYISSSTSACSACDSQPPPVPASLKLESIVCGGDEFDYWSRVLVENYEDNGGVREFCSKKIIEIERCCAKGLSNEDKTIISKITNYELDAELCEWKTSIMGEAYDYCGLSLGNTNPIKYCPCEIVKANSATVFGLACDGSTIVPVKSGYGNVDACFGYYSDYEWCPDCGPHGPTLSRVKWYFFNELTCDFELQGDVAYPCPDQISAQFGEVSAVICDPFSGCVKIYGERDAGSPEPSCPEGCDRYWECSPEGCRQSNHFSEFGYTREQCFAICVETFYCDNSAGCQGYYSDFIANQYPDMDSCMKECRVNPT
jgi:hypothetical protein